MHGRLVELAEAVPEKKGARSETAKTPFFERIGAITLGYGLSVGEFLGFIGELTIAIVGQLELATQDIEQLGQTPNIVAGRRITDDKTLDVMKMVVAGLDGLPEDLHRQVFTHASWSARRSDSYARLAFDTLGAGERVESTF